MYVRTRYSQYAKSVYFEFRRISSNMKPQAKLELLSKNLIFQQSEITTTVYLARIHFFRYRKYAVRNTKMSLNPSDTYPGNQETLLSNTQHTKYWIHLKESLGTLSTFLFLHCSVRSHFFVSCLLVFNPSLLHVNIEGTIKYVMVAEQKPMERILVTNP